MKAYTPNRYKRRNKIEKNNIGWILVVLKVIEKLRISYPLMMHRCDIRINKPR